MKSHLLHIFTLVLALTLHSPEVQAQDKLYRLYQAYQLAKGAYKAHEALNVTEEELAEYMKETMRYQDAHSNVCSSKSPYTIRLKKITKGLTSIDGVPLNFKVYNNSKVANAFASPDGSIRVYSKLMDIMTDDEVLGIIGHELGHIAGKHSLKQYKAALMASAVRDGLMASDGTIGEFAASSFGSIAEYMVNAKYSRDQESEADDYGYDYLVDHHRNPIAIALALNKLKELNDDKSGKYTRYVKTLFSTHPDITNRVNRLKEKAEDDGYDCSKLKR